LRDGAIVDCGGGVEVGHNLTDSWLRMEAGSWLENGFEMRVSGLGGASGNALILAGGKLLGTSLTFNSLENYLVPEIQAGGLEEWETAEFSGNLTFGAGTKIRPCVIKGAPAGNYTVLRAANIIGFNGEMVENVDPGSLFSCVVNTSAVDGKKELVLRYRTPTTLVLVR